MLERSRTVTACAVLFAGQAFAATDDVTGVSVDPPEPFVTEVVGDPVSPARIIIYSSTGTPAPGAAAPILCAVSIRSGAGNQGYSQEELKEFSVRPEMINLTKASLELVFNLDEGSVFAVDGVSGIEFIGSFKSNDGTLGPPVYIASMQTPAGITMMNCMPTREDFDAAVPQFRTIRDTISPAR
jgi:hypothetical protein